MSWGSISDRSNIFNFGISCFKHALIAQLILRTKKSHGGCTILLYTAHKVQGKPYFCNICSMLGFEDVESYERCYSARRVMGKGTSRHLFDVAFEERPVRNFKI